MLKLKSACYITLDITLYQKSPETQQSSLPKSGNIKTTKAV